LKTLHIAVAMEPWRSAGMDPEVKSVLRGTVKVLEGMGHQIEEAKMPFDVDEFHHHFTREFVIGIAPLLDMSAAVMGRKISSETVEPLMFKAYEQSKRASAVEHFESLQHMNSVSRSLGGYFESVDLILTPTLAVTPPEQGVYHLNQPSAELDDFFELVWDAIPYTPLNNYTGTPAISLPLGESSEGLPIGMHFMAPFGREDRLLRLAVALEAEMPWEGRKPAVHITTG
jgi:amidase